MNNHENQFLYQWHETHRIEEDGIAYFLKKYEPNSYEIKNEIGWLMSTMVRTCESFDVPEIKDASVKQGFVKMNFIDVTKDKPEEILRYLVQSAMELHSLVHSTRPQLRTRDITETNYKEYVHDFARERIEGIGTTEYQLPKEIADWILGQIDRMRVEYFTIVHRDLRARHLLFSEGKLKPTLIDWEFANISEPAQDVAKVIYDATVVHSMDRDAVMREVIDAYAHDRKESADELRQKVMAFLPIIPLEHSFSFVTRKPDGYEAEVLKDLCFIRMLYEENT